MLFELNISDKIKEEIFSFYEKTKLFTNKTEHILYILDINKRNMFYKKDLILLEKILNYFKLSKNLNKKNFSKIQEIEKFLISNLNSNI